MTLLTSRCSIPYPTHGKRWWPLVGLVWVGAFVYAWSVLADHAYKPAKTPDGAESTLRIESADSFRIVVFAHPFCPCTRATLNELDESRGRMPRNTSVSIVFVSAGLNMSDVVQGSLVHFAKQLHGVQVRFDDTGMEARRFEATTSGEAFAFDPAGKLVYHGGLTPGRGHQGDAIGQEQLEQIVRGGSSHFCTAPIYGCSLPGK